MTTQFENEYFKSEKKDDGTIIVTVLKDINEFFEINLEGCKFITNKFGFIKDEFTDRATDEIKKYCKIDTSYCEQTLKTELRCRTLNTLMSMLPLTRRSYTWKN